MMAEEALEQAKKLMSERDSLFEELDGMYLYLRDEHKQSEKMNMDQQKIIENLEEELQQTKEERDNLQNLSDER